MTSSSVNWQNVQSWVSQSDQSESGGTKKYLAQQGKAVDVTTDRGKRTALATAFRTMNEDMLTHEAKFREVFQNATQLTQLKTKVQQTCDSAIQSQNWFVKIFKFFSNQNARTETSRLLARIDHELEFAERKNPEVFSALQFLRYDYAKQSGSFPSFHVFYIDHAKSILCAPQSKIREIVLEKPNKFPKLKEIFDASEDEQRLINLLRRINSQEVQQELSWAQYESR